MDLSALDDDKGEDTAATLAAEKAARKAAEERAERLEAEANDLRTRHAPKAPATDEDRVREDEDRRLAHKDTTALEKWQIEANRALRAGRSAANSALAEAHDVRDRTAFTAVAMSDPIAKKYEARVEQELARMRANGQNAPREAIYTFLLGKDMRDGKFKKKAAAEDAPQRKPQSTPGARSDVPAKGGLTEQQKREKRLENVRL